MNRSRWLSWATYGIITAFLLLLVNRGIFYSIDVPKPQKVQIVADHKNVPSVIRVDGITPPNVQKIEVIGTPQVQRVELTNPTTVQKVEITGQPVQRVEMIEPKKESKQNVR